MENPNNRSAQNIVAESSMNSYIQMEDSVKAEQPYLRILKSKYFKITIVLGLIFSLLLLASFSSAPVADIGNLQSIGFYSTAGKCKDYLAYNIKTLTQS